MIGKIKNIASVSEENDNIYANHYPDDLINKELPIIIKGSLDNPDIIIDMKYIIKKEIINPLKDKLIEKIQDDLKENLNSLSNKDLSLRKKILEWYDQHGRYSLPWKNQSIYLTWISEIMLQQTQVKTVIPFLKTSKKYPKLKNLIGADLDSILNSWSGLGYYRRAKNIFEACRIIESEYRGIFPESYEEILKLPGIGRTTAGAIATFAGLGIISNFRCKR